jgi:hypothetical protein
VPSTRHVLACAVHVVHVCREIVDAKSYTCGRFVPSGTLSAYFNYTYIQNAWLRLTPDEQVQTLVNVTVGPDAVQARIAGGDRIIGQTPLRLDGRGIDKRSGLDMTDPSFVPGEISYRWECFVPLYPKLNGTQIVDPLTGNTSGPCLDRRSNYSRLMIPAESDVTIPPDTLLMQVSRPCSQSVSPTTSNVPHTATHNTNNNNNTLPATAAWQ